MSVKEHPQHQASLPKTEHETSMGVRMNTLGMNAIKLVYDPESQQLYQQESNGNFVVSDMQLAASQTLDSNQALIPGPALLSGPGTRSLSKSKLMKNLETPTFLQQASLTFN